MKPWITITSHRRWRGEARHPSILVLRGVTTVHALRRAMSIAQGSRGGDMKEVMMKGFTKPRNILTFNKPMRIMLPDTLLIMTGPISFKAATGIEPKVSPPGDRNARRPIHRIILHCVISEATLDKAIRGGVPLLEKVRRDGGAQALMKPSPNISCRLRPRPPRAWKAERAGDTDRITGAAGAPKHPSLPPEQVGRVALRSNRPKARGGAQRLEAEVGAREQLATDALPTSARPRDQGMWPSVESNISPSRLAARAGPNLRPMPDGPCHGHRDLLDSNLHRRDLICLQSSDISSSACMLDPASHLTSQCVDSRIPRPILEAENIGVHGSLPG